MAIPICESDAALSAMYSASTESDLAYTRRKIDSFLSDVGDSVRSRAYDLVARASERVRDTTMSRTAQAVRSRLVNGWLSDDVRMLTTVGNIQNAKPIMRNYISGMRSVREARKLGRIRLYDDQSRAQASYRDIRDNAYYREAKHTMLNRDSEGSYVEEFTHTLDRDQERLSDYQRMVVQATEDAVNTLIESAITDPTDPWNRLMD